MDIHPPRLVNVLLIVTALVWLLTSAVIYLDSEVVSAIDFFPRWYGTRQILSGANPYSEPMTDEELAADGVIQYAGTPRYFLYPATITYILLPFWLLPFPIAASLWRSLQIAITLFLSNYMGWKLKWKTSLYGGLVLSMVTLLFYRHPMEIFFLGQFPLFVLASMVLVWRGLRTNKPWMISIGIIGTTVRPEGMLIAGFIALELLWLRRYKEVLIAAILLGLLVLLPTAQIGFWIPDFIHDVIAYRARNLTYTASSLLGGQFVQVLLGSFIALWSLALVWLTHSLHQKATRVYWHVSIFVIALVSLAPITNDYVLVLLLFPIWLLLSLDAKRPTIRWISYLLLISPTLYLAGAAVLPSILKIEWVLNPLILLATLTYHAISTRATHFGLSRSPSR